MNNKLALITGATSGIGAAFAKKLASQNYDLIITGRRADKINQLATDLTAQHKVKVEVMLIELAKKDDLDLLVQKVTNTKNLDLLINNAAFNIKKPFLDVDVKTHADMLIVNDYAPMRLMYTALPSMLKNDRGAIINVSSVGAFWPTKNNSHYCASKAYLNFLTEAVAREIKNSKVRIQALCPGMTRTDIWERMGSDIDETFAKRGWPFVIMTPEEVVEDSLRALEKNKLICIPRYNYKLLMWLATLKRSFSLL
jgi:short-subunit dehydrogenase